MADALYEDIPGLSEDERQILKRQRITEAMLAQSQQPVEPFTSSGRMVVPMQWTQGLAQLLKSYNASKGLQQSEKDLKGISDKRNAMIADAMTKYRAQSQGGPVNIPLDPVSGGPPIMMQQQYKPDQEGATFDLLGNPAVPESTRQAAQMQLAAGYRREDKADARAQRMQEIQLQLDDKQLSRDQHAELMKELIALKASTGGGGDPYFTPVQTANGVMAFNARTGKMEPVQVDGKNVVGSASDPTLQGDIAAAKKRGAVLGEAWGGAEVDLPKVIGLADQSIQEVKDLLNHPGFKGAVGATLLPGARFIEGTDAANFMARLAQIQGGAFMEAYKTLKGGGQITEIEGAKATSAITRMSKSQSEDEFKQAAQDYIDVIGAAVERVKNIAAHGGGTAAPAAGSVLRFNEKGEPIQ